MTFALMKAFGHLFSTFFLALALTAPSLAARAQAPSCANRPSTVTRVEDATLPYPSFCSIPRAPTGVRTPAAFRTSVVKVRRAGRELVRASGPGTFGLPLTGAADMAAAARAEAAPPPAMNPQSAADDEAFARQARARATPPTRPH